MKSIGVGLYGSNGHQIYSLLSQIPQVRLRGVVDFVPDKEDGVPVYATLEDMLKEEEIHLISVCSPKRSDQHQDILKILQAKKHVFAEKPLATSQEALAEIMATAQSLDISCIEMDGSLFDAPYHKAAELLQSGRIGQIIQIFAQKSYPYAKWRPQDEAVDGGLILQNALYCIRFVEHITGQSVKSVSALETRLGNPVSKGGLHMACSLQMELANGGLATAIANYLNPPSTGIWGNEELRVFGSQGLLQTHPLDKRITVWDEEGCVHYDSIPGEGLFEKMVHALAEDKPLPIVPMKLIRPTEIALLAKKSAAAGGQKQVIQDLDGDL